MKGTDWLRARPAMLVSNFGTDRNAWRGTNGGNRSLDRGHPLSERPKAERGLVPKSASIPI